VSVVAVLAGAVLVAGVVWDIAATVLHPTQRGPLCQAVNRGSWVTARTVGRT
jgi:ABC-type thiamin/hydroxymethylpyrimidine transport system permease subunit